MYNVTQSGVTGTVAFSFARIILLNSKISIVSYVQYVIIKSYHRHLLYALLVQVYCNSV